MLNLLSRLFAPHRGPAAAFFESESAEIMARAADGARARLAAQGLLEVEQDARREIRERVLERTGVRTAA